MFRKSIETDMNFVLFAHVFFAHHQQHANIHAQHEAVHLNLEQACGSCLHVFNLSCGKN